MLCYVPRHFFWCITVNASSSGNGLLCEQVGDSLIRPASVKDTIQSVYMCVGPAGDRMVRFTPVLSVLIERMTTR